MRRFAKVVLAVIVLVIALWSWGARPLRFPTDYVLVAERFITHGKDSTENAVWVEDGVIRAVGTLESLSPPAEVPRIDFSNSVVVPGLIEPHTHPIASALLGAAVDVSGFSHSNRQEVMNSIQAAASDTALTPWLVAFGWDPVKIPDLDPPTLEELDALSPDRPMLILTQMLHEAFVNSAALEAAGFPDSHGPMLRELEEVGQATAAIPAPSPAVVEFLLRQQYQNYAKAGFTTIGITGAVGRHPDPIGLLRKLGEGESTPLRSYLYLIDDQEAELLAGARFGVLGTKFWVDGSPFTGAAAVEKPYADTPLVHERLGLGHNHDGPELDDEAAFFDLIAKLHREGHQLAFHVQGERAVDRALDAIELARDAMPNPLLRHRLEHNALITQDQMKRAAKLDVSLGFFIDHVTYYGERLEDLFGKERTNRYMPAGQAEKAGLVVALHGDHPATPLNPLQTFRTAVTRKSLAGPVIGVDQKLSREAALAAMTANAAEQLGQGPRLGRIAPGYRADFTILSADPLTVSDEDLSQIEVDSTIVDGQPVDLRPLWYIQPKLMAQVIWSTIF